jgi:hypothetical protein
MTEANEDAIWALLRDRAEDDRGAPTGDVSPPRTNREALVAMLDAALGVLSATRHLVEVTEDVVREQRDRLASESDQPAPGDEQSRSARRRKIDLSY